VNKNGKRRVRGPQKGSDQDWEQQDGAKAKKGFTSNSAEKLVNHDRRPGKMGESQNGENTTGGQKYKREKRRRKPVRGCCVLEKKKKRYGQEKPWRVEVEGVFCRDVGKGGGEGPLDQFGRNTPKKEREVTHEEKYGLKKNKSEVKLNRTRQKGGFGKQIANTQIKGTRSKGGKSGEGARGEADNEGGGWVTTGGASLGKAQVFNLNGFRAEYVIFEVGKGRKGGVQFWGRRRGEGTTGLRCTGGGRGGGATRLVTLVWGDLGTRLGKSVGMGGCSGF